MAKKRTEQLPLWSSLDFDLYNPHLHQGAALLGAVAGALLALAVLGVLHTPPTDALANFARSLFGLGALIVALSMMAGGLWALRALLANHFDVPWRRVVGCEVLLFALLALIHMPFVDGRTLAESGGGG